MVPFQFVEQVSSETFVEIDWSCGRGFCDLWQRRSKKWRCRPRVLMEIDGLKHLLLLIKIRSWLHVEVPVELLLQYSKFEGAVKVPHPQENVLQDVGGLEPEVHNHHHKIANSLFLVWPATATFGSDLSKQAETGKPVASTGNASSTPSTCPSFICLTWS